jgi:predicted nucleic acid-binding protein
MAFLLDTNIVSELRKKAPDANVVDWSRVNARTGAYISALVVGEIRQGIERVRPRDPKQADVLEGWLDGLVDTYQDRILPVSVAVADEWGRMNAAPKPPPVVDGLMAATAKVHRLTLATRNVADVARTGVPLVNPFDAV